MATDRYSAAQVSAMMGQNDIYSPHIFIPHNETGDPLRDLYSAYANLLRTGQQAVQPNRVNFLPPVVVWDDFTMGTATANGHWFSVDDGGTGTNVDRATAGGWISVVTAAADNDYHSLRTYTKPFLFAANKPLAFEMRMSITEGHANYHSNWIAGLMSLDTTGGMVVDGGGPLANYDGAVFFKTEQAAAVPAPVNVETSLAAAQVTELAVTTHTTGAAPNVANAHRYGFTFNPNDNVTGIITFYVDGVVVGTNHNITLAGATPMWPIFGVVASAEAETMNVDYIGCIQAR